MPHSNLLVYGTLKQDMTTAGFYYWGTGDKELMWFVTRLSNLVFNTRQGHLLSRFEKLIVRRSWFVDALILRGQRERQSWFLDDAQKEVGNSACGKTPACKLEGRGSSLGTTKILFYILYFFLIRFYVTTWFWLMLILFPSGFYIFLKFCWTFFPYKRQGRRVQRHYVQVEKARPGKYEMNTP